MARAKGRREAPVSQVTLDVLNASLSIEAWEAHWGRRKGSSEGMVGAQRPTAGKPWDAAGTILEVHPRYSHQPLERRPPIGFFGRTYRADKETTAMAPR